MATGSINSRYWQGPRVSAKSVAVRADAITKTQWMDLYFHLYKKSIGYGSATSQEDVIADAEWRLNKIEEEAKPAHGAKDER